MTVAPLVNPVQIRHAYPVDLYDVGDIPDAVGELVPGEPSSIREVAAALRRELYSGRWSAGDRFRTAADIAEEHRVSSESANVALRMLRNEGLVTLEQGRGTFVCPLADYAVTVTISTDDVTGRPPRSIVPGDPAVKQVRFEDRGDEWRWTLTIRAADAGRAAVAGLATAARTSDPATIDLARASVRSQAAE
jgi:DNA-binding transcriptional MocR family regulator